MRIRLTRRTERTASEKRDSDRNKHASEVDSKSPCRREELDEVWTLQVRELRQRITEGIGEADRGELVDGEQFVVGLLGELGAKAGKRMW